MSLKLLLCLVSGLSTVVWSESPVVEGPAGKFKGHLLKTRDGRNVLGFQGIPYAQPPVGSLRFKEPMKMPRLEGTYEAVDDSKDCYQPIFDFTSLNNLTKFKGSEDCLYLNVYTPPIKDGDSKLPVFVWIHGGGYFMASGSSFYNGPKYLLDKDMVLVTINYRLGVVGFLSTGDDVLPGNIGMKDQVLALRWVQENIAAFGGDPKQVTIGGESAGASSVVQHMYSPLSRGLFRRSIAQSGSIDCLWATKTREDARRITEKFAAQIQCPLNKNNFIACLQSKNTEQLFLAANAIKDPMGLLSMEFVPVIEEESAEAFLTETSIQSDSDIPLIIGVTNYESLGMPAFLTAVNAKYSEMSGIRDDHEQLLPIVTYYYNHPDASDITRKLVGFYFRQQGITDTSHEQLINLVGDMMFNHAVHLRAKKHKGKTFMYMFSYKGQINTTPFIPAGLEEAVGHSDDLLYLFNFDFIPHGPLNSQDRAMSDKIIDLWFNFIRSGDPTPVTKVWEESAKGTKYLDLTKDGFLMKSNMFEERMNFLDNLNVDTRESFRHDEL